MRGFFLHLQPARGATASSFPTFRNCNPLNKGMKYLEFTFTTHPATEVVQDVLSAVLADIGFDSFVHTDELDRPAVGHAPNPESPELAAKAETDVFHCYIQQDLFRQEALDEALAAFPLPDVEISYTLAEAEDKDWNEEWEKNYFKPIRIGNDCLIRASFHEPEPGYTYTIIIDPKMAFGTGNHETTYLMISWMLEEPLVGKRLLDMGCGTAVLAILARMKGAEKVVAIDIDEWAYENALENIRLNHTAEIEVALGGAERIAAFAPLEVIFANINRNILLQDMHHYAEALQPGGQLFMSGFYVEDLSIIEAECQRNGLRVEGYKERHNWVAVKVLKA